MKPLVDINRVVELTGLSAGHIYRLVRQGKLGHLHFGGRVMFAEDELKEWIERYHILKPEPYYDLSRVIKDGRPAYMGTISIPTAVSNGW